ncbi:MAG: hypothetical protein KGK03_02980 [Candidatus Omnitrophica bacterium]|nr:hypothetical protein [Candidatus Omnitrophota bacterium]
MASPQVVPLVPVPSDQQKDALTQQVILPQEKPSAVKLVSVLAPAVPVVHKGRNPKYAAFLDDVSPEDQSEHVLYLVQVPNQTLHKDRLNFVFLMNGLKPSKPVYMPGDQNPHKRLHVMWTNSKKLFKKPQIYDKKYPVDFSISNYKDGYTPGQWNLVAPGKKPREVDVTLVWTF